MQVLIPTDKDFNYLECKKLFEDNQNLLEDNENFDYVIYDNCKVGDSKHLEIPEIFISGYFDFLKEDDMPYHYEMSDEEIKIITQECCCYWADKALELGYKECSETEKDMCNYLKGELILDEFSEDELKTFENVDNYVYECIKNFKENINF